MTSTQLPPLQLPDRDAGLRISISFCPDSDAQRSDALRPADRRSIAEAQSPGPPLTPTSHSIPVHPIPSLQEAFTESLDEVTNGNVADKPKLASLHARARRDRLLAQDRDAKPFDFTWRYRPGQEQHELAKLLAQISFGVYLLLNGMANSNMQVINILQGHIDEVDEYLEVTLEDLSQALVDLNARIDHLKLPLSNIQAFEVLLEDRGFRRGILEANEKIDHILCRTDVAMKQWDDDIESGLQCTAAFTSWLKDQEDREWRAQRPDVANIFDAMKGNAEGWRLAFDDIHDRAQEVNNLLIRLMTVIAEMEKKAGEVSRRTWAQIPPYSAPSISSHGDKSLSIHSTVSSRQSVPRQPQRQQASLRSVSPSGAMPGSSDATDADGGAVPPVAPLVPGRSTARDAPRESTEAQPAGRQTSVASAPSPSSPEIGSADEQEVGPDESLYVLQPRIYSPRTLEQHPSPALDLATAIMPKPEAKAQPERGHGARRSTIGSLRQRLSIRSIVPDAIHVPPKPVIDVSNPRPSSKYAAATSTSQPFDSAYCSDSDVQSLRQASEASLSPPVRPHMVHSPRSDHLQYYLPVEASPHSPLQQRPHTAMGPRASQSQYHGQYHEHMQPSRPGGTRSPSNAMLGMHDGATTPAVRSPLDGKRSPVDGKSLKKKRSTFGWFKKAFSLDEEERAEFEARRARSQTDRYYDHNSPKFLDGRRIR